MMTKYCPKRQDFDYPTMVARCQLAAIDHNFNTGRDQKKKKDGSQCFAVHHPKSTGLWTSRSIFDDKDYAFKRDILKLTVMDARKNIQYQAQHQMRTLTLPKNIAKTPALLKDDLVDVHMSRFA